jgi:uncharacterized membrane protein YgcG
MPEAREAATPRETDAEKGKPASNGRSTAPAGPEQEARPGLVDAATQLAGRLESVASEKAESAVAGRGFATLLGWVAENVIAVTRIGSDVADLAVRNLRLAGRKDLARLGMQQARTEDKLERLLQEVERLEAELRLARSGGSGGSGGSGSSGSSGGANRNSSRSSK